MGISQVSWGWLLKVTPMHSYTHRGHTLREGSHSHGHKHGPAHGDADARGDKRTHPRGEQKPMWKKTYTDTQGHSNASRVPALCQRAD